MHVVRDRFLIHHQLVTGRHCEIDADSKWIARVLGLVGLLNDDVATADMIAKAVETRGFAPNDFVELVGFLDSPIRDANG